MLDSKAAESSSLLGQCLKPWSIGAERLKGCLARQALVGGKKAMDLTTCPCLHCLLGPGHFWASKPQSMGGMPPGDPWFSAYEK